MLPMPSYDYGLFRPILVPVCRAKNLKAAPVYSPQSGFSDNEQFLQKMKYFGDGRAGIQSKSFRGTEQVLKVMGSPRSGGFSL
jgi:hypothetical protein